MQELVAVTFHLPGAVDLTFVIEAPQVLLVLPALRDGSLQVAQRGRELVALAPERVHLLVQGIALAHQGGELLSTARGGGLAWRRLQWLPKLQPQPFRLFSRLAPTRSISVSFRVSAVPAATSRA